MQKNEDVLNKLFNYFRKEKISINKKDFNYTLKSHPHYPKLSSISDTLDTFEIEYNVLNAPLQEIDKSISCFLASFHRSTGGTAMSFVQRKGNSYKIDSIDIPLNLVEKYWGNTVVILGENARLKKVQKRKSILFFLVATFITLALLVISNFKIFFFSFYALSIFGIVLSIFTLKNILGIDNSMSEKICEISQKTDCETILNSKKWRLSDILNFSDLSLVFFSSQLVTLIISSLLNSEITFFYVQSIFLLMSLPLIFISIYYQKFVERKWCTLCLGIILLLTLELSLVLIFTNRIDLSIGFIYSFALYALIFGIVYSIWNRIKKILIKNTELLNKDIIRNQTLLNYPVFKSILTASEPFDIGYDFLNLNESSKHKKLILITDPFCEHCKNLHHKLHSLSNQLEEKLNWNIVFNVDIDNEPEIDKSIYRNLMRIQSSGDKKLLNRSLEEWYKYENEEKWLNKYSQNLNFEKIDNILKDQHKWCVNNKINFTPVLLIKGYVFPSIYDVEDLKFLIDELLADKEF